MTSSSPTGSPILSSLPEMSTVSLLEKKLRPVFEPRPQTFAMQKTRTRLAMLLDFNEQSLVELVNVQDRESVVFTSNNTAVHEAWNFRMKSNDDMT